MKILAVSFMTATIGLGATSHPPSTREFCQKRLIDLLKSTRLPAHVKYQPRPAVEPDRCEGQYVEPQSGDATLVSTWRTCGQVLPRPVTRSVELIWPEVSANVWIRVQLASANDEYKYLMDTWVKDRRRFSWPANFVDLAPNGRDDLVPAAWFERGQARIFVPIAWSDEGSNDCAYQLVLSGRGTGQVELEIESLASGGRRSRRHSGIELKSHADLRRIELPFKWLEDGPGEYRIKVSASKAIPKQPWLGVAPFVFVHAP